MIQPINDELFVFLQDLLSRESVTPQDSGCQKLVAEYLAPLGFANHFLRYGEVSNLWSTRSGQGPLLVFVGHTDVVSPGPYDAWNSHPFIPEVRGDYLYARGAADMKASIAAMAIAMKRFLQLNPYPKINLAFLLTSDEEGLAVDGTAKVVEYLLEQEIKVDFCIVGEPTSSNLLGDKLKIGRRGSLTAKLKVYGKQGHIAYPDLAVNPIHSFVPALSELLAASWDNGCVELFPRTEIQFSDFRSGLGVSNIIPGDLEVCFNFRFSPGAKEDKIKALVESILSAHNLKYDISWYLSARPFISKTGQLLKAMQSSIEKVCAHAAEISVDGGTSDARFMIKTGCEIVEFGPINKTIHQANECIKVNDVICLSDIYLNCLNYLNAI